MILHKISDTFYIFPVLYVFLFKDLDYKNEENKQNFLNYTSKKILLGKTLNR